MRFFSRKSDFSASTVTLTSDASSVMSSATLSKQSRTKEDLSAGKTKDFEAAYGALSSMYGFGGATPASAPRRSPT
ncbi:hypothetical protein PsYK624_132840 [Phanerochaete sordida]|uniref:Uncharacterized protein n=1 Tax=Phanerochaete sordida TaxID=48140 RepID=A0A9P3LJV8_9APHY|nr:hypothetical protein PsYK624_132840 [Phanerochaete sordida]